MDKTLDIRNLRDRPLGRVTYRPGIVRPGHIAAVRTPEGLLLRRIYYYREAQREMVRLVSILPNVAPLRIPLADVEILGPVLNVGDVPKAKRKGVAR